MSRRVWFALSLAHTWLSSTRFREHDLVAVEATPLTALRALSLAHTLLSSTRFRKHDLVAVQATSLTAPRGYHKCLTLFSLFSFPLPFVIISVSRITTAPQS